MDILDQKYRTERLLGEGGMGRVYQATHLGTKRTVAVKVIHPQLSNYTEFVTRFRREAEAAGRLRHPNVVDVTDFGLAETSSGPVAYLVMEYLDGCTLADILTEEQRLPISWVVDILDQVCSALDEARRLGIIHRDLKPENIWLEPNRRGGYTVKVLDFGIAKLSESDLLSEEPQSTSSAPVGDTTAVSLESDTIIQPSNESLFNERPPENQATLIKGPGNVGSLRKGSSSAERKKVDSNGHVHKAAQRATNAKSLLETPLADNLTRVGSLIGTPLYMSPEQCRGEKLDARSDIYSLGVIAYRALTGVTPFTGTPDELFALHQIAAPEPVRKKNRRVPTKMARIVMSALAKNPADRPENAAAFASALRASVEGSGHLLRRSVALYSEHFPAFLKISLLGYAPLILVLLFINFNDYFFDIQRLSGIQQAIYGVALVLSMVVTTLLAHSVVSVVTVPIVVQLMTAPLKPIRIATALSVLRRRWLTFVATSLLVMAMILLGTALFVVPGVLAAVLFALYTPVVIMEPLGVWATLKRASRLSRRAWSTSLIITTLQFALPLLVWRAAVNTSLTLKLNDDYSPKEFGFNINMSGRSAFYQLLNIFVTPLTAIMISLLYLKTRRAGGESLKDATEQLEGLEVPRSKWQTRMRSQSASVASSRGETK